jgi:hypothetical protein
MSPQLKPKLLAAFFNAAHPDADLDTTCARCCQEEARSDILFIYETVFGLIAQWIEHLPSKPVVVGSSPTQSVCVLDQYDVVLGRCESLFSFYPDVSG